MKDIIILGSTGSIGTQALKVIRENSEEFNILGLTCGNNIDLFKRQIEEFSPKFCVCKKSSDALDLSKIFPNVEFSYGSEGLNDLAKVKCNTMINALMGMRGLVPTYIGIKSGNNIALANKETLVAGGNVIMEALEDGIAQMIPVDSEHSAIFQCLEGNHNRKVQRLILTASGGPFRGLNISELSKVTPEMALNHPNWSMGRKITIDSATMMNKGLEIIEARWLFNIDIKNIHVLIHPQSIVHSGVEFEDNSILVQMGVPDMKIPISLALGYPNRIKNHSKNLDFFGEASKLTFQKPDLDNLPCLDLAIKAGTLGGSYPVVMNGANEVLVEAFLDGKIKFLDIPKIIEKLLEQHEKIENPQIEEILFIDSMARKNAKKLMESINI